MSSLKTFLEEKETAMMKAFVLQCKKNIIQLEKEASEAVKLYKDKIDLQKALLASFKDWDDDEMTEEEIKTSREIKQKDKEEEEEEEEEEDEEEEEEETETETEVEEDEEEKAKKKVEKIYNESINKTVEIIKPKIVTPPSSSSSSPIKQCFPKLHLPYTPLDLKKNKEYSVSEKECENDVCSICGRYGYNQKHGKREGMIPLINDTGKQCRACHELNKDEKAVVKQAFQEYLKNSTSK